MYSEKYKDKCVTETCRPLGIEQRWKMSWIVYQLGIGTIREVAVENKEGEKVV